jgi:hypothetical protein
MLTICSAVCPSPPTIQVASRPAVGPAAAVTPVVGPLSVLACRRACHTASPAAATLVRARPTSPSAGRAATSRATGRRWPATPRSRPRSPSGWRAPPALRLPPDHARAFSSRAAGAVAARRRPRNRNPSSQPRPHRPRPASPASRPASSTPPAPRLTPAGPQCGTAPRAVGYRKRSPGRRPLEGCSQRRRARATKRARQVRSLARASCRSVHAGPCRGRGCRRR